MSKPAIALYLGESYATAGLFDIGAKKHSDCLLEKSVYLPQTSLKSLLNQIKIQQQELLQSSETPVRFFIVAKYFDRLKQFRLGGSIAQVVLKGFENSYTLCDSKSLSLAASQLIISIDPAQITPEYLQSELDRVKKINPDLNKTVISLPEESLPTDTRKMIFDFFNSADLKVFVCPQPHNQSQLRKTLLNAGSEGTKEEMVSDIREVFGENTEVLFFCRKGFTPQFENSELFNSSGNFLSQYLQFHKQTAGVYFDIESLRYVSRHSGTLWQSPWGSIPLEHTENAELSIHPLAEVNLNQFELIQIDSHPPQLEPGPVVAGRAIKPLVLDLFYEELQENQLAQKLFLQMSQDSLKKKLKNMFTVLEKSQKNPTLSSTISELKTRITSTLLLEAKLHAHEMGFVCFGPLADIFCHDKSLRMKKSFDWSQAIMEIATEQGLV